MTWLDPEERSVFWIKIFPPVKQCLKPFLAIVLSGSHRDASESPDLGILRKLPTVENP